MNVTKIRSYFENAKSRLIEQYKEKPNMAAFLRAYSTQFDDLEDAAINMYLSRSINHASGAQLDGIGQIVGQPRNGVLDNRYRQLLSVRIGQNISQGQTERVISIFLLLTGSAWVHNTRLPNASLALTGTATFVDQREINFIFDSMHKTIADGVRLDFIVCAAETGAFAYAGNNSISTLGYGDGSVNSGGTYAQGYVRKLIFAYDGVSTDTLGYGAGPQDALTGGSYAL